MIEEPIAVCGIDCANCGLLKASFGDAEAAEQLAGWWKSEGWMSEDEGAAEVLERGPHCLGCRGDRHRRLLPRDQGCPEGQGLQVGARQPFLRVAEQLASRA